MTFYLKGIEAVVNKAPQTLLHTQIVVIQSDQPVIVPAEYIYEINGKKINSRYMDKVMEQAKIAFDNLIKKHGLNIPVKQSLWDKLIDGLINWSMNHKIPEDVRVDITKHSYIGY